MLAPTLGGGDRARPLRKSFQGVSWDTCPQEGPLGHWSLPSLGIRSRWQLQALSAVGGTGGGGRRRQACPQAAGLGAVDGTYFESQF